MEMHSDNQKNPKDKCHEGLKQEEVIRGLQASGCLICNHLEQVLFDFLASWQYALAQDETAQQQHAADIGFCPLHTWQLAACCSARGLSRGQPTLLMHAADQLSKQLHSSPVLPDKIEALVKHSTGCRVCRLLHDAEAMCMERLVVFLEVEDVRNAYAQSHGVCLKHLSQLISRICNEELARFLVAEMAGHLRETAEDMRRYVSKQDSLQRHLINRRERYAHLRAMIYLAGARNVCTPHGLSG